MEKWFVSGSCTTLKQDSRMPYPLQCAAVYERRKVQSTKLLNENGRACAQYNGPFEWGSARMRLRTPFRADSRIHRGPDSLCEPGIPTHSSTHAGHTAASKTLANIIDTAAATADMDTRHAATFGAAAIPSNSADEVTRLLVHWHLAHALSCAAASISWAKVSINRVVGVSFPGVFSSHEHLCASSSNSTRLRLNSGRQQQLLPCLNHRPPFRMPFH